MSLVQMVSDFNGNVEINGVTYLSSSIQVSVNEENSDAINMKYFKDFIVFNVNYSDFEYGVTLGGVTVFQSAGNTLQEVLDRIDILLDDSIFKGTVAALAGAFPNSSGSYSGRAIHAVGESYLGGQVDVDGGLSVSSGNSTLNNFSVNNYAVFNTGTQTAQGGEIRLAQAVQNHVGQGGTDTAYYTKVRGAASLNNHVVVSLPSVPIPNSGGPYAIVQDPLTGNASWADTSTFGGGGGLWTQTGNDIYYNTGNVGIGTAAPESSLHIAGTTGITMGRNSVQNRVARVYADAGDNLILTAASGSGKVIKLNNYVFGNTIDWAFTNSTGNKLDFTFNPNGWGGSNAPSLASFNSTVGYSTGDWKMVKIENTLNQTGDASFTDLFINRTENSVGIGNQYFIDAQNNGTSKFSVNSQGKTYSSGGLQTIGDSYGNTVFMGQKSTYFTIESSHVGDMMRFYPSVNKIQTVQPLAVGSSSSASSTDLMGMKHWSTNASHNMIRAQKQDGSDAFFLKSDGKVGIGTATPDKQITLHEGVTNLNTSLDSRGIYFSRSSDGSYTGSIVADNGGNPAYSARNSHRFFVVGDQTFAVAENPNISGSGVVAIGSDVASTFQKQSVLSVGGGVAIGSSTTFNRAATSDGLLVEGNVGIGTTTPASHLDVNGGSNGHVIFRNSGNASGNGIRLVRSLPSDWSGVNWYDNSGLTWAFGENSYGFGLFEDGLAAQTRLMVKSGGNIGIGTASPNSSLHVSTPGYATARFGSTNNAVQIRLSPAGGNYANLISDTTGPFYIDANTHVFRGETGGNERMRITSAGNVGIGTTTPSEKLDVEGNLNIGANQSIASTVYRASAATGKKFEIRSSDTNVMFQSYGNTPLSFQPGGGGSVSFGTQVAFNGGVADLGNNVNFGGGVTTGGLVYTKSSTNGATLQTYGSKPLYINPAGNGVTVAAGNLLVNTGSVGIGIGSPSEKLHVAGQIKIDDGVNPFTLPASDGTANQVLSTDGAGTVSWVDQSGGGGGASTLNDLTDVLIPSVADGDLLNYNSAFSSWIPVNSISLAGNITSAAIVQGNTGSFTTTTSESYKFVGTGDFSIEPATTLGGDLYIKSNKDIIVEIDTNNNDTPSKFSVVDGTERFSVDDAGVARFNNAFSLPNADGTTGQVLSTDGSGAVTWVDQGAGSSDADIQLAYKTTDQTLTTTFTAITAWDGEYYDDQTAFDPTTGTLTITQAGTYFIQADVVTYCTVGSSRSSSEVYLEFNGGEIGGSRRGMYNRLADNGTTSASIAFPYKHTTGTATFKLVAGQTAGSDTVVVSNAFFSSVTLGGAAGAQGISGDAFQVAGETSGRTLVAGDHLNYIRNTSATAVTYTVPPQSSVAWVDNAEVVFEQAGTGQITIAAGAGVTINSSETLKSGQQYAVIGLKRVASDTWTLTGERESA